MSEHKVSSEDLVYDIILDNKGPEVDMDNIDVCDNSTRLRDIFGQYRETRYVDMILQLQDVFNIYIPPEAAFVSVGDVVGYIEEKCGI